MKTTIHEKPGLFRKLKACWCVFVGHRKLIYIGKYLLYESRDDFLGAEYAHTGEADICYCGRCGETYADKLTYRISADFRGVLGRHEVGE